MPPNPLARCSASRQWSIPSTIRTGWCARRIEARLRQESIGWDWRCFDGPVVETLIAQSRLADVVVISQPTGARPGSAAPLSIIGDVVMHAAAPLLVVPTGGTRLDATGAAMLAWNGSAEAAHAMRAAVPLLRHAAAVHIVEVSDDRPRHPGKRGGGLSRAARRCLRGARMAGQGPLRGGGAAACRHRA